MFGKQAKTEQNWFVSSLPSAEALQRFSSFSFRRMEKRSKMDAVHDRYASLELEEVSKLPVISLERLVGFLSCPKEGHGLKRCACVLLESGEVQVGEDCLSSPQDAKTCQPCIELPVFPTRPPQVRVPCNRWHLLINPKKPVFQKSVR